MSLRDFGFAARAATLDDASVRAAREAGAQTPAEMRTFLCAQDLYALGYALAETVPPHPPFPLPFLPDLSPRAGVGPDSPSPPPTCCPYP